MVAPISAVDDINRLKRWGQAAVAVTRVDLAIGPLGKPYPGRLISHLRVRELRFNQSSSDVFPPTLHDIHSTSYTAFPYAAVVQGSHLGSRDQPLPSGLIYLQRFSPSPRGVRVVGSHLCQVYREVIII